MHPQRYNYLKYWWWLLWLV